MGKGGTKDGHKPYNHRRGVRKNAREDSELECGPETPKEVCGVVERKSDRKSVCRDKKTALEYKAQLETQISRGKLNLPVRKYSIESFIQEYLQYSRTNKSPGAVKIDLQAIKSLNRILQPRTSGDISPAALEKWKSTRLSEVSPVAVNIELRQIKAMVRKGIQWGYMDPKQIEGVNQLKVPKKPPCFMSKEEISTK